MLILKALLWGPRHGYAIMRWIRQSSQTSSASRRAPCIRPSSHGDCAAGSRPLGRLENKRQAKYYELTSKGRERYEHETAAWSRYVRAVSRVLEFVPEPAP
jgi:DNA-binding PadR family transcriptional regulator